MDLEELRTVLRTERERDGLQHLRESFYRDVAAHLADLKTKRKQAAEQADDPFSDPEVRRLTDRIETAEDVVESLYERRVGKVVKRASFAAAGMSHDDEGLTDEERDLFDDLVARIERNRTRVLDSLDPDAEASAPAGADDTPTTDASAAPDRGPTPVESAADPPADADTDAETPDPNDLLSEAMGGTDDATGEDESAAGTPTADGGARAPPPDSEPSPAAGDDPGPDAAVPTPGGGSAPVDHADAADDTDDPGRMTVYVTRDVGEIYGVDERTYRLEAEDVVALPADNARPLVERGAAEPLE